MRKRLQAAWESRGWLARVLWPLAVVLSGLVRLRFHLYRWGVFKRHRLPVPVLAVGNMAVGGTGKTPMAVAVVQHLRQLGFRPIVVSRGYGGLARSPIKVDVASPNPTLTGDEPLLLARLSGAPVWVGQNRVATALAALATESQADVVVLDDGMQHWSLASDILIVLFDQRGLGNGWLLPAGLLREPWPPVTWGAQAFWVQTRGASGFATAALPAGLTVYHTTRSLAAVARNRHGHTLTLAQLAQRAPLGAVAGIAHPQRFFGMLEACGLALVHQLAAPDHADTATLLSLLTPGFCWLCTEKDAVKLFEATAGTNESSLDLWAVGLETHTETTFWAALTEAVEGLSSPHGRKTA